MPNVMFEPITWRQHNIENHPDTAEEFQLMNHQNGGKGDFNFNIRMFVGPRQAGWSISGSPEIITHLYNRIFLPFIQDKKNSCIRNV